MSDDRSLPSVSVILPAYNAGPFIAEALQSVLDQDYPALDVIVMDDGSKDDTEARVAPFLPRVRYFRQPNSGGFPGEVRNAGIRHATGEYLAFLDADDVMLPGRIRAQSSFLSAHPDVGLVFSNYRNFSSEGPAPVTHFEFCELIAERLARSGGTSVVLAGVDATRHLAQENFAIPSATMLRRKVLDVVPGFPKLQTSEDFMFFYLVARRCAVAALAEPGAMRRLHSSNATGDFVRALNNYTASRALLRESETDSESARLLADFICHAELQLAREYGDRKLYGKAFAHNLRALRWSGSLRFRNAPAGLRMLARTAAIATQLKSATR